MASIESKIINFILRQLKLKGALEREFVSGRFGNRFFKGDMDLPPKKLLSTLNIEKTHSTLGNVFTLKPKGEGNAKVIFYLHGGAYIHGFNKMHWKFFNTLIQNTKCTIIAPDYPLAPKFTYKDSFAMVKPVYKELIDKCGRDNVILMGDSAGGGFALALAENMKHEGYKNARRIVLLSPWLDITLSNEDINEIDSKDNLLGIKGLQKAGKAYAGKTDPSSYHLSPINGSFDNLGEISVFIGTNDILEADTRKFKKMAQEKAININYYEYNEMFHVWMLINLPESKKAIKQIFDIINK